MRRLKLLIAILSIAVALPGYGFERISSGLDAYESGDFLLASRLWEDDARVIARKETTPYDKRISAFAFVLASMSAARAKDRRAYELWGEAESLLAELGTRWSEQAVEYRASVARLADPGSAQVSFEEGAVVDLSANDLELQRLSGTGVLNYEKPPSGLVASASSFDTRDAAGESSGSAVDLEADDGRRILSNRSAGFFPDYDTEDSDEVADAATETVPEVLGVESEPVTGGNASADADNKEPATSSVLLFRRTMEAQPAVASSSVGDNRRAGEREVLSARVLPGAYEDGADSVLSNRGGVPAGQELGADELSWARVAWRYFEEAEQSVSGLADAHPGHARVSAWDIGSHIAALVSAHQLDVITDLAFAQRAELLLNAIEELPLYDEALPNRNYTSDTVELLDANGTPAPIGSGWSAVDIGRLLVWLKILSNYYPVYSELTSNIVTRWDLSKAVNERTLVGAFRRRDGVELFREGRFGFEHYAAQGFVLWGAMSEAPGFENTRVVKVGDLRLSVDSRPGSAVNGYALMLLQTELGCAEPTLCESLNASLRVQREAARRRGSPVAVSDYHLDKAPWFATTNFAIDGSDWNSISVEGGRLADAQMSLFTTKAAFLTDVLSGDGVDLMSAAADETQASNGFLEGLYVDGSVNRTLSLSTNAAVLQALWYRRLGRSFLEVAGSADGGRKTLLLRRF